MPTTETLRTVDEIIDALQVSCSQASGSVAALTVILHDGQVFSGSAYCVDKRGYFVTAYHCVEGVVADCFIVLEALHKTSVVAVDEDNDLALLKVEAPSCEFEPVTFSQSVPDAETIVAGLGFPGGLAVSLESYLARYYGAIANGIGPDGDAINGNTMQSGLCFVGAQAELSGYSGGPLLNEHGHVVANTSKACAEAGFVMGPSSIVISAFVQQHLPVA